MQHKNGNSNNTNYSIASQHHVSIVIHHNGNSMGYFLTKDTSLWSDDIFIQIQTIIPTYFKLEPGKFALCNSNNTARINNIDDLLREYQSQAKHPDFKVLLINIITEHIAPPPVKAQPVASITESRCSTPESVRALEDDQDFFTQMQVMDTMQLQHDMEGSAEPAAMENDVDARPQRAKTVSYSKQKAAQNPPPRYNSFQAANASVPGRNKVTKEGYVWKKGKSKYSTWNKRYFQLRADKEEVRYYATESMKKIKGMISLEGLSINYVKTTAEGHDSKHYGFCIVTADRRYKLSVASARDRADWVQKIRQCVDPNYKGLKPRTQSATFADAPAKSIPLHRAPQRHKKHKKASSDLSSMRYNAKRDKRNEEPLNLLNIVEEDEEGKEAIGKESPLAHRVYLLSPYKTKQAFVSIAGVSDEYVEMRLLSQDSCQYLWCLDIIIPIEFEKSSIRFNCFTDEGVKQIQPKYPFQRSLRSYYHIERDNADANKGRGWFNGFDSRTEAQKASSLILGQLLNAITNWKTYNENVELLLPLQNVWTSANLWSNFKKEMMNHFDVQYIFKLLLLVQAIDERDDDKDFEVSVKEMYYMVEILNSNLGFCKEKTQHEIGIAIYDAFITRVEHFCSLKSKYISPEDYLLLYSMVNLFRYFEKVKYRKSKNRKNKKLLQWINYKQNDEYFIHNDAGWMQLDLMKMLRIDLDIGLLPHYHRLYPLENMILRLCSVQHNRGEAGVDLFRNTLETISGSTRSRQQIETVITDIFKYDQVIRYIFDILGNDFDGLWRELILILEPQRIAINKKILDAFHENLKWQIAAMDNDNVKLQQLDTLIMAFESKRSSAQPLPKSKCITATKYESCKLCNVVIKDGTLKTKFVHVHNCKFCGSIVCPNCSTNRRMNHRICDYCYKDHVAQDIVDTVNIRLALLRNNEIITYVDDEQMKRNIKYILKIALRGDVIDENIASELITFMVKLFMMDKCRNIALMIFTPFIMDNITFSECFRAALKRTVHKVNIPVSISMFLSCPQFYSIISAHRYFINLFVIKNKNEIQSWNARRVKEIQSLVQQYASKGDKSGINLWNDVFHKLIHLPHYEHASYSAPRRMSNIFSKKTVKNQKSKPRAQQEAKYAQVQNEESDSEGAIGITLVQPAQNDYEVIPHVMDAYEKDINASFITELDYCLAMTQWIKFAIKMKQIPALKSLLQYSQSRLRTLNEYISTERHINIKSIASFQTKQADIIQLSKDCDYFKRFDDRKLNAVLQELNRLKVFKLHLIRFLGRYTVPNEDAIRDETHDFVDYIKHWDLKQYSEVKARPEWNRWMRPNDAKFKCLFDMQSSDVFYNIWCLKRREMNNVQWNVQNYLNRLYPKAKQQWDDLVDRGMKSRLTFHDISWFKDLNSTKELNMMKLPQNKIRDTERDISQSLKINKYVKFVDNLTKFVVIFIEKGNTRIRHRDDKKWFRLKDNLIISEKKKNDKTQSISDVARLYRDIKDLVGAKYSNLHIKWIATTVKCHQTVYKMANDEHFQRESLQATLELLDDSNDGEMTQLSGSLRSVYSLFLSIWQKEHKTKTDLMQFIANIELKTNDVNNLLQVHDALPRIDNIVKDVSKNAGARDMNKMDEAMRTGYFRFDIQDVIRYEIHSSSHIEIAEIGNKCLHLNSFDVPQIQGMIDIILLSRSSCGDLGDDEEDDEKHAHIKGNVKEYIQKVDICKDISELRVKFILIGGRMREGMVEKIKASSPLPVFNRKQNEWKEKVQHWQEHVLRLRHESHLFNYYTINNIRLIIEQLNGCKSTRYVLRLRFQELLAQFRFARPELTDSQLKKTIKSWKKVDVNSDEALSAFNKCFNNKDIMNVYDTKAQIKSYDLTNARPNLCIVKERSEAIFATLNSYFTSSLLSSSFTNLLSPHQVLLCTKLTTSEDIFIFIFRCLQNEKRFKYNGTGQAPLYCLLFPEDLNSHILDETIHLFNHYLLCKNQAVIHYSLLIISCDENNTLCQILSAYRTNTLSSALSSNICNYLFNGMNDGDMKKNDKPFIQLYVSSAVGLGKSFMIKQRAKQWNGNETDLIRIPFNSPKIDTDFVVERLYKAYDGKKRKKIIYHIDISPSATNTVNDILFSLFFLKFIKTSNDRCFSVTNHMAFFIEEPTDLASLKTKQKYKKTPVKDQFYILHSPMVFNKHKIDHQSNPFQLNDNCHYSARFLFHFYNNDLQTQDPEPLNSRTHKVNKLSQPEHDAMMRRHFASVPLSSPIRRKAFWEYLYTQFDQVIHSTVLRNEWHKDNNQYFNKWKHLVTESIIDLAEDFTNKLYDQQLQYQGNEEKKYDESDGTEHFHLTQKWQTRSKPIVLMNQSVDGSISFLVNNVNRIGPQLKKALDYQKFDVLGWDQQQNQNNTKQKKIELLLKILGTSTIYGLFDELLSMKPYCDYALTFDNMLKMIAIFFRVKANIPVILMGETGCGKTCLLNYLAKAANIEIERADVHGGFTADHIRRLMKSWIAKATNKSSVSQQELTIKINERTGDMQASAEKTFIIQQITKQHEMQKTDYLWIFFDEINTSPDIGYFKEIVCDGHFDGEPLPRNMKVIAACNPYRKRNIDHLLEKSILNDPLARYVYRVYPLPSTMKEYVWMFGSLSANDEAAYASQMCQTFTAQILHSGADQQRLANCIVAAQGFVRKTLRDSAMVSLRDIARCLKIFVWIYEREKKFNKAMIMSIALVYYFRLNDAQRKSFSDKISPFVKKFQKTLIGKNEIIDKFCVRFKDSIPKGIALNRALKENLFLLFLCIQTKTPLILIGKPGSSKTLAMSVVREYLSDHNRQTLKDNQLLPIHVVSFQCSAQSRAEGIQQRWAQTQKYAEDNKRDDTIYVLLLDEIGLAEHSPYRPLKVLHQLLEIDPLPISFIGLSNWSLDAAKMNRVICHLCPTHSMKDLVQTGIAMAQQYAVNAHDADKFKPKISLLSNIYTDVMHYRNGIQPRYDFFGARDFYSVVRHFLTANNKHHKAYDSNEELIMYFLRNFGGIKYERINGSFVAQGERGTSLFGLLCKHLGLNGDDIMRIINKYAPSRLVSMNLNDTRSTHEASDITSSDNFMISRHVMVITEYYNSWNILLDLNIIKHNFIFIFGSQFERDKSNIYLYLNKIKNCMETGKTLILCNLEEIHESLYDMLNQRYTYNRTSNKMYCRIALGSNSERCFVDPSFKCIVITTKQEAHKKGGVPIAFLNRFEKQLISYYSSLTPKHDALLRKLEERIFDIYCIRNTSDMKKLFPGFCKDTFASLILNKTQSSHDEERKYDAFDAENVIKSCVDTLKDVALAEALIQSAIAHHGNKKNARHRMEYLSTLQSIMERHIAGKLLIILTFDFASKLQHHSAFLRSTTSIKQMTDFSKAEEFALFIHKYLRGSDSKGLLLQYRHQSPAMNHFIHIKHIIESAVKKYEKINPKNKKRIAILVHLRRTKSHNTFPLILSDSSKTVFLDSVSQTKRVELNSLASQTIEDICKDRGNELLTATFQRALSHLQFAQGINLEHEIKKLCEIFEDNNNPLQKCIMTRLMKLLSDNKINRNVGELVGEVVASNSRWSRGSFYEQLYDIIDKIAVVAMMRVLQILYEHDNIGTLHNDPNDEMHKLFIDLYSNFDLIEVDPITQNLQNIIENRPNKLYVKHEYSAAFPFSKVIHEWCNSHKTKLNLNQSVMDSADNLRREMTDSMPSILNDLPIAMVELYINDLIRMQSHQLQIDKTWSPELFQLITKYMVVITSQMCDKSSKEATISVAEVETVLFYKHALLYHLIRISSILPLKIVRDMLLVHWSSMMNLIGELLRQLLFALDSPLYQLYNANSIGNSIEYVIENMDYMQSQQEMKSNDDDENDTLLVVTFDILKLKMIAIKNKLDITQQITTKLLDIYDDTLCDGKIFIKVLRLFTDCIPKNRNINSDTLSNILLCDLLSCINLNAVHNRHHLLGHGQFLVDLLCNKHNINDIKWNKDTEFEITKSLFKVLSHESIDKSKIMSDIKREQSGLAGMIIQSMNYKQGKHSRKKQQQIKFVHSQKEFNKKLEIRAPLIQQFNPQIYDKAMESISIASFFRFFQKSKLQNNYPLLCKLRRQPNEFWHLSQLPDVAQWIKLIHSKYMGTLSASACTKFTMDHVFKQCQLHKWGDPNAWKQRFAQYKQSMNEMSNKINLATSDYGNVNIPISCSLMAKQSNNKYIKNTVQCMDDMIRINNDFVQDGTQVHNVSFFDLRKNQLIDIDIILNIIRSNAKSWICFDIKQKAAAESYIIFDLDRIESEIRSKCIFARYKLRIKYQNFAFVGSKNMLKLIQSIRIKQETLNYEIWHSFDTQFESNLQRKRALTVIEDVIALLCSSNGNKQTDNDNNHEFYYEDDDDDDKEDEKDNGRTNIVSSFMRKFGAKMKNYDSNEELWHFMQYKLKISKAICNLFKLRKDPNSKLDKKIQLKHIQSLWNELIKRIDGEMIQYEDQCLICYMSITEGTPIKLECCGVSIHYDCLKRYIQSGFGNNGDRITLRQLSCLLCRHPMRHKAASDLFKQTQLLYDKVSAVALKQLRQDNKSSDPQVKSPNGEYFNHPAAYAMKLYAFFLCYQCKEPYFFGTNQCGDEEAESNVNKQDRLCTKCDSTRNKQWIAGHTKKCPKCQRAIEKNGGCNHMTCRRPGGCGHQFCWLCLADWYGHNNCRRNN